MTLYHKMSLRNKRKGGLRTPVCKTRALQGGILGSGFWLCGPSVCSGSGPSCIFKASGGESVGEAGVYLESTYAVEAASDLGVSGASCISQETWLAWNR